VRRPTGPEPRITAVPTAPAMTPRGPRPPSPLRVGCTLAHQESDSRRSGRGLRVRLRLPAPVPGSALSQAASVKTPVPCPRPALPRLAVPATSSLPAPRLAAALAAWPGGPGPGPCHSGWQWPTQLTRRRGPARPSHGALAGQVPVAHRTATGRPWLRQKPGSRPAFSHTRPKRSDQQPRFGNPKTG
jgi:hypothetical protein